MMEASTIKRRNGRRKDFRAKVIPASIDPAIKERNERIDRIFDLIGPEKFELRDNADFQNTVVLMTRYRFNETRNRDEAADFAVRLFRKIKNKCRQQFDVLYDVKLEIVPTPPQLLAAENSLLSGIALRRSQFHDFHFDLLKAALVKSQREIEQTAQLGAPLPSKEVAYRAIEIYETAANRVNAERGN
jgi:hypothetical protein